MSESENIINEEQPKVDAVENQEQPKVDIVENQEKQPEVGIVKDQKEQPEVDIVENQEEQAPKKSLKEKKERLKPVPDANFDWNCDPKKDDNYKSEDRAKLEAVYEKTLSRIGDHEVIEGTIVAKTSREVVVNIGFKSDGVIPISEFRHNPDLKIGDKIEVYVENQEGVNGQLILSHKKARILKSWDRINQAYDNQEIIQGYVKSRTKGGLIVDVFGIEAFLPGSQIDVKPIRDYDVFVDSIMEFKVVKINQEYKNVVVSHKALIEDEIEQQKIEIISKLEKGQVLEGVVKNITSYGVFVDLGGVDGLIHITDLSWGRINHPDEIVHLDEQIKVVILDFDDNKKRIALGLKQLTPHPWDALDPDLKVGDVVKGKVVVIADYGAFIEIAPGVEGLIHVSEMSWSQHLRTAQDFLKIGDEVQAKILTLDREERKMSFGIKQLIPDPWENIKNRYPIGSKHTAIVRNFTNFGIFVELEEGVDGLIHISDLSWSKKIKHPAEFTKINDQIDVIVLDVDEENRRLSLGHKQLEENPWDVFENIFTVGSIQQGTIISSSDKGVIVSLPYGVEGFCPNRHLKKEDGTNAKVDETLDFKVIEFSKENKKIILSHSRIWEDKQNAERNAEIESKEKAAKSTKRAVKQINENIEHATLGDIEVLAELKENFKKAEKAEKAKKVNKEKKKTEKVEKAEEAEEDKKVEKTEEADKVEEVEKIEKTEEVVKAEKVEEVDKVEKIEEVDKVEEVEKTEKTEKTEEVVKAEEDKKVEKTDEKTEEAEKEDNK